MEASLDDRVIMIDDFSWSNAMSVSESDLVFSPVLNASSSRCGLPGLDSDAVSSVI